MAYYFEFTDRFDHLNSHPHFEIRFSSYRNMLRINIYAHFVILIILIWITTTIAGIRASTTDSTVVDDNEDIMNDQPHLDYAYDDDYDVTLLSGLSNSHLDIRTLGIIQSDKYSTLDEAKAIMKLLQKSNISFSGINLTDYGSEDSYSFKKVVGILRAVSPNAVIGPYNWPYAVATEHLRMPYFVTTQTPLEYRQSPFLIQMFPDAQVFAKATEDMLRFYGLNKLVVFHDSDAGQVILERLSQRSWMEVSGFFINSRSIANTREQLKIIRSKFYTTFICVLNPSHTHYVLDEGLSLSMFSPPHNWILVNMDLLDYSLDKYVDSHANITVLNLMKDSTSNSCALGRDYISLSGALLHDAVRLVAHMRRPDVLMLQKQVRVNMGQIISKLETDGCTGHLRFEPNATRSESFLQITTLEGYRTGMTGTWRSLPKDHRHRIDPSKSFSGISKVSGNVFGDVPLRITVILEEPFVQRKLDKQVEAGHPEFEGFLIDILLEMVKLLNFKFTVSKVPDGKFGSLKTTGWTGMVRQLVDNKADIALAPFQMSTQRAEVVDFTKPFMTKGTTVVVMRPDPKIWMFQFLSPFSNIVWSAIFVAFVGTSLMLFAVSRVNSDKQAKYTHNLRESFWYMWGTLLRGSLNGSPHAISSRIISSAWWFFCLILSSIYTANLAAFLTITIGDIGINTAQDLAKQSQFDYGTVEGSQTETFFNHTQMMHYSQMWAYMSVLSRSSMSKTTEIGFDRVKKGRYAFIWDSPTIRYKISNDCALMEIGSPFDLKGYGFAHQKNAPYGDKLSWALLKLQDDGVLYRLERKWWRPQICPNQQQSAKTESLDLTTVAGMFVVILGGAAVSAVMCLLQYCYSQLRRKRKSRIARKKDRQVNKSQDLEEDFSHQVRFSKPADKDATWDGITDEVTYASHSPLQFVTIEDWT